VLAAAVNKMIHDGEDADWVLGGDVNAPLASGDFDQLSNAGLVAVSQQDADAGAISYIKGPKSLIDHIYLSPNLAAQFDKDKFSEKFTIISAEKEIPDYVKTISDHRPIMLRIHIEDGGDFEESVVAPDSFKTPEWVKKAFPA
jgi:predicted extracellular nuclease